MSTAKMCETPCETCKKEGLPLLLARYAVHTTETKAPALSGKLGGAPLASIPLGAHAQYGLRLLRSGYVYVHDEARKHWDEYFVTADGFLTKLPPRPKTGTRAAPATVFACARSGAAPLAGVITIRNPKHATTIWIGFSDVEWTDDTLSRHNDAAYRQRHMQKISISGGKVSPQPHTAPLEEVDSVVPEFKLDAGTVKKQVTPWVPFQFNSRVENAKDFKLAVQQARPQGGAAVVALFDPVGMTAEIDALMTYRLNSFAAEPKRQRPLAISQAVLQLEDAIRAQAVEREEAAAEDLANQIEGQADLGMLFKGYRDKKLQQIEEIRTVTPTEAKRAEDAAWKSYTVKFNEPAMKQWRNQYEAELTALDAEQIVPLAAAHRDWMKCGATSNYFACNFDEKDVDNGVAYVLALSVCIGNSQDKAACFDLYKDWLGADKFEQSNLLLNAYALNLDVAKKKLQEAANVNLDWRGFSWDGLAGSIGETYKGKLEGALGVLGTQLVVRTMGPLATVANASAAAGRAKLSLVSLSVWAGKPYTVIDVVGGKKAFRQTLIRQLVKLSKQPMSAKQLQRAVSAEMRRLQIAGVKLDGTQKKRFLIFLDDNEIVAMPKNLDAAGKAQWAASKLKTAEDIEAIAMERWQTKLANAGGGMVKGGHPYLVGLVGAIFQYYALAKLTEDDEKAMSHETEETKRRMHAGMAAFWGTVADVTGQGLQKVSVFVPKAARGLEVIGKYFLSGLGRVAGIAGAGIVAYWDGKQAGKANQEGKTGLAILYGASAALGFSAASVMFYASFVATAWAGPVAWILVGLLIAVAVLIEFLKDNKIQEWLKRSWWGNGPDAKYPDIETEMAQLKLALA